MKTNDIHNHTALEKPIVIVGNYGGGKTEVAVNLAAYFRYKGESVTIADLDLVNPYFRTREARDALRRIGVEVILPDEGYLNADLPILSPSVAGMIRRRGGVRILDVGGDDAGATVLASLGDSFEKSPVAVIQVVNPFRPFTETFEGCIKIRREIESASKIEISGLIGNPNLIDSTTIDTIYDGYGFVKELSERMAVPLLFLAVSWELLPDIDPSFFDCPILPIKRQLVPPWKKPAGLTGDIRIAEARV